jgi:hypothetical protein
MFVGHYGVSFAAKRVALSVPLWVLFIAVQVLDVFYVFFGPPPVLDSAAAWTALVSCTVFAAINARMKRPSRTSGRAAA